MSVGALGACGCRQQHCPGGAAMQNHGARLCLKLLLGCARCRTTCFTPCQHPDYTHRAYPNHGSAYMNHSSTSYPHSPPAPGAAPIFPAPARAPQPHKFQPGALKSLAGPVVFVCGVAYRPAASCLSLAVRPRLPGPGGLPAGLIRMMDGEGAGSTVAQPLPGSPNRPSSPRGMWVQGMRSCPKDGVGASGFLAPKAGFGAAHAPALGGGRRCPPALLHHL